MAWIAARNATIEERAWGEVPWPGASKVTTEQPLATSGPTKLASCAPRPPQPWTSRALGPWPHVHVVTGAPSTWTIVRRAPASTEVSCAGAG